MIRLGDALARSALRLRGFSSGYVQTYHGRVHYYDVPGRGTGPPIVFIHGIGANASHWGLVLGAMRRDSRRVIAIDLLGHGFSDTPDALDPYAIFGALADAIEALVDEPVVVVGNSLGGGLGLSFALMRPERVVKLLLLSPGGAWMEQEAFVGLVEQFRMREVAVARDFLRRLYGRAPFYVPLLAYGVRAIFRRPPMLRLVDHLSTDILHTPETLAALRVPARILWGKMDRVLPKENLEFFRKHLGVAITEPEGVGHCPQIEDPRLTVRWLREALA